MTAMPLCRYGCGRLERLWGGRPDLDYHPSDCPGHKIQREEWSMDVYGVPDIFEATRYKGKAKITLEVTVDTFNYFTKGKLKGRILESYRGRTRAELYNQSTMFLGTDLFKTKKCVVKKVEFLEHAAQPTDYEPEEEEW